MYTIDGYTITIQNEEDLLNLLVQHHNTLKSPHTLIWPDKKINNGYVEALIASTYPEDYTYDPTIPRPGFNSDIIKYNIASVNKFYYRVEIPYCIRFQNNAVYINTKNIDASSILEVICGGKGDPARITNSTDVPIYIRHFLIPPVPYNINNDIYNLFGTKSANLILKKIK